MKQRDWADKRVNAIRLVVVASPWINQTPTAITTAMAARCATLLRAERARTRRIIRQMMNDTHDRKAVLRRLQ